MINSQDEAILSRIVFIPCLQRFERNPKNTKKVESMIANDINHFFSLMVDYGALWWQDNDLTMPKKCQEATDSFVAENNDIDNWIESRLKCEPTEEELKIQADKFFIKNGSYCTVTRAYRDYSEWCAEEGKTNRSKTEWIKCLEEKQFKINLKDGNKVVKCKEKHVVLKKVLPSNDTE